jgi:hypothetical protein
MGILVPRKVEVDKAASLLISDSILEEIREDGRYVVYCGPQRHLFAPAPKFRSLTRQAEQRPPHRRQNRYEHCDASN